jgi:hypothetical protein
MRLMHPSRLAHLILRCGVLVVVLALGGLAQAQSGKVLVYKQTLALLPTDQRGDMLHTNDVSGLTKAGWSVTRAKTEFTSYLVMDLVNKKQARVSYFTEKVQVGTKKVTFRRFQVHAVESGLPITRVPTFPSPSEQWIYISGGEDILQRQTAGADTATETDDVYEPGVDTQPTDPMKSPDGKLDSFGLSGSTFLWNGRAVTRPLTLAASQLAESQVADADKAVYADAMVQAGLEVRSYMLSNYEREPSIGFPGHSFTLQTSQPSRGLLTLEKVLTYNANDVDADASGPLTKRTVENTLELIRAHFINLGYTEVF